MLRGFFTFLRRTLRVSETAGCDMSDVRLAVMLGVIANDVICWIQSKMPALVRHLRESIQARLREPMGRGSTSSTTPRVPDTEYRSIAAVHARYSRHSGGIALPDAYMPCCVYVRFERD